MFMGLSVYSQELVCTVETPAEFPGGEDSMVCFLEYNVNYDKLNQSAYEGRVYVQIVVDTLGKAVFEDITCVPEAPFSDTVFKVEAERVVKLMPAWKPAILYKRKVPTLWVFPIVIPYHEKQCQSSDTTIYYFHEVDSVPHYQIQDGDTSEYQSINNFSKENFRFPNDLDCEGIIYIQFVINKDGSLSNFNAPIKFCDWDKEAIRVLRTMPAWKPAIKDGVAVRCYFIFPIDLQELL